MKYKLFTMPQFSNPPHTNGIIEATLKIQTIEISFGLEKKLFFLD